MSRGLKWIKCDLHIHTSSSYDHHYKNVDSDDFLVKAWRKEELSLVAITDHFLIDADKIVALQNKAPEITVLPGVELRCDKGASNLHIIIIFPNDNLYDLANSFNVIMRKEKAKASNSNDTIYWDYNDIIEYAKNHDGIITIHAGKKDKGLDRVITNKLPVNIAIKEEFYKNIDIYEMGAIEDLENYNIHVFNTLNKKPMIICSDNHDPRNYQLKDNLWIKATPTFEGLVQAIKEPELRFFIGSKPAKLNLIENNKDKFIDNISITGLSNNNNWFKENISLNSDLVTIIGNKGSGKSALADIIAHAGNTHNNKFSFLSENRFNQKKECLGINYEVKIKWMNGLEESKLLYPVDNTNLFEKVKYLPQQYIEYVCNDLKDGFNTEIERLIFDYLPHEEKLEMDSLQDLMKYLTSNINSYILDNQNKLKELNLNIINLQESISDSRKNTLKSRLSEYNKQLENITKNKPLEVPKPQKSELQENELSNLNADIQRLKDEIEVRKNDMTILTKRFHVLESAIEDIEQTKIKFNRWFDDIKNKLADNNIDEPISAHLNIDISNLLELKDKLKSNIDSIKTEVNTKEIDGHDGTLIIKLQEKHQCLEKIMSTLSDADLNYQKSIQETIKWNEQIEEISSSIIKIQDEQRKLEEDIPEELEKAYKLRKEICLSIYNYYSKIVNLYEEKYSYINESINNLDIISSEKPNVEIDFNLNSTSMATKLFRYINHNIKSIFLGKEQALKKLNNYIENIDMNNFESIYSALSSIEKDLKESSDFDRVFKDKAEFLNELYGLSYIAINYNLKLGDKLLSNLSPGERGLVLLIFYLVLDKDQFPLIIDQPEDNLDNQSIFIKLVPYIIKAKERRQIIIVTHNPNIAVACDSEQIIYSTMDKEKLKIHYSQGSMDMNNISNYIINVLEGTMPAFYKRKNKYDRINI
ncbi:TrlF family AAA-like ATPase [Clostridium beijerinckii]|uniref:ABC-type lipoprotein export system ATPase subunit n=1 Tax=Clostridium beijerinckii TaxID=1520 RepID=A0AAX0B131_CLOBE|nr:hypothetical protein [Clostridium beijerinckii]NRT88918.1 ABC-type lipoprotein export system ATPase subunit [Clostridium beijerinckii]NYC74373.1 ABC-type lipoprotein export system ATPase subunit/septal ring factor EnvC (AmiA/AmiB activator) [Clostridium beijerinckii]